MSDDKTRRPSRTLGRRGALGDDERGAYQVEYLAVLVLVSLVTVLAITAIAVPLVMYHASVREALTSPVP